MTTDNLATKEESTAVATVTAAQKNVAVATQGTTFASRFTEQELAQSDINNGAMIPDSIGIKALPLKLNTDTWSPEIGEVKDFVVLGFGFVEYPDMNPEKAAAGVKNQVRSAFLAARGTDKAGNAVLEKWNVSAKRLVSTLEDAAQREYIVLGNSKMLVRITLVGKIRNKTNAFSSDNYDVELVPNF